MTVLLQKGEIDLIVYCHLNKMARLFQGWYFMAVEVLCQEKVFFKSLKLLKKGNIVDLVE